jgi:SNF2 family DNA or RNA helicase
MDEFKISYDANSNNGVISCVSTEAVNAWERINASALALDNQAVSSGRITLPWYQILTLVREYAPLQKQLHFKFVTDDSSKPLIQRFVAEQKVTNSARNSSLASLTQDEVVEKLRAIGFTKRDLRKFQRRDIVLLASIPHGANFSVPGAGKTTVTLALHLLACNPEDKLLVVCPKAAFPAWAEIIDQCITPDAGWAYNNGQFINLCKLEESDITRALESSAKYFVTNYEHFVNRRAVFGYLLSTQPIHLVLDESHRMKAGQLSQRGAALLSIANLPKRKDILSGTPMPQGPSDLQAQLDFLWPGSTLGQRVQRGEMPKDVIAGLYSRTTKEDLGLPPVDRKFIQVPMTPYQAALYGIVKNDVLRQLSSFRNGQGIDIVRARKSVMRLLQLASNPILAIRGISQDVFIADHAIINAIVQNPTSPKIEEVCRLVRENVNRKRKTVVWTIFTQNILDLERQLVDLNPVSIYGQVKTGADDDDSTREGRLKKFHVDSSCWVMIANPAAAGEGISLHEACHEAIYLDRSYVSTHYLQSIDRIHRLGLPDNTETNIKIIQAAPPAGLGSIDYSVSRRLAKKIRALEQLLNDRDLHKIALDEESVPDAVDFSLDIDDIADLIEELEGNTPFNEDDGL